MPVFWLPPFNIQLCCDSPSPLLLLSNFGVTYSWYWFLVILFYCFLSSLLVIINVLFISVPAYYHSDTPHESLFANRWLVEPRLGVDHLLLLNSWGRKTVDGCVFAVITTPVSEMSWPGSLTDYVPFMALIFCYITMPSELCLCSPGMSKCLLTLASEHTQLLPMSKILVYSSFL